MPFMIGFAENRRNMLQAELMRFLDELPPLGVQQIFVIGDFALSHVGIETALELLIIQETDEPFHRRSDFFVDHLRPRIETRFYVYTPDEFDQLKDVDPFLVRHINQSEAVYAI
tara:strand:- start:4207 stop:4548 length:342 start_codon:yes stop_codon:yes gene_type:complete